jgi:hypothetical protein
MKFYHDSCQHAWHSELLPSNPGLLGRDDCAYAWHTHEAWSSKKPKQTRPSLFLRRGEVLRHATTFRTTEHPSCLAQRRTEQPKKKHLERLCFYVTFLACPSKVTERRAPSENPLRHARSSIDKHPLPFSLSPRGRGAGVRGGYIPSSSVACLVFRTDCRVTRVRKNAQLLKDQFNYSKRMFVCRHRNGQAYGSCHHGNKKKTFTVAIYIAR